MGVRRAAAVKMPSPSRTTVKEPTKSKTLIVIPPLKFIDVEVSIVGDSPYLVARWTEKATRQLQDQMTKHVAKPAKGMRDKRDPEAEFEAYKIIDDLGRECIPALHLKCAMVNAGIRATTGTYKADIRAAIRVLGASAGGDLIPFKYKKCVMRRDMVRNKSGQPDIRWRPEYHGWSAKFRLSINEALMDMGSAINLINLAGNMVGLGEWRVEKGGSHGMFHVVL